MKTYRLAIIAMAFLAVLATGCKKDKAGFNRLGIVAENFQNNGKVQFNPNTPRSNNQWVVNEPLKINDQDEPYYIASAERPDGTMYFITRINEPSQWEEYGVDTTYFNTIKAIYPGESFGGNDGLANNVTVGNNEMVLHSLQVNFPTAEPTVQRMAFPMIATTGEMASTLYFKHLTGGFKMTLVNNDDEPVDVASMKIIVWGTNDSNFVYSDDNVSAYTVRWFHQGPAVPEGEVGQETGDVGVNYNSEMNFTFRYGSDSFMPVPANGNITFCVPVTISSVRYLTVIGYGTANNEIFRKVANISATSGIPIESNHMYAVPQIPIN